MAKDFNDAVMTNGGAALLTKAQAGECYIEFTRMAIGDGTYTDAEKEPSALKQMTNLKDLKNSYNPSGVVIHNDTSVRISARLTNYDSSTKSSLVTSSYYINEIGLFAKEKGGSDSTEVLYSIATVVSEPGDEMPAYNGENPIQIVQEYYATVDNSATVTIEILEGAYALEEDVEAGFERVDTLIGDLQTDVAGKAPTNHASTATTYGQGNASNYGHVKLSDTYTSSSGAASAGVAASNKAVYDAYTALEAENVDLKEQIAELNNNLDGIFHVNRYSNYTDFVNGMQKLPSWGIIMCTISGDISNVMTNGAVFNSSYFIGFVPEVSESNNFSFTYLLISMGQYAYTGRWENDEVTNVTSLT